MPGHLSLAACAQVGRGGKGIPEFLNNRARTFDFVLCTLATKHAHARAHTHTPPPPPPSWVAPHPFVHQQYCTSSIGAFVQILVRQCRCHRNRASMHYSQDTCGLSPLGLRTQRMESCRLRSDALDRSPPPRSHPAPTWVASVCQTQIHTYTCMVRTQRCVCAHVSTDTHTTHLLIVRRGGGGGSSAHYTRAHTH